MKINLQSNYLEKLKKWGFKINPLNKVITGTNNLMGNYNEIEKEMN